MEEMSIEAAMAKFKGLGEIMDESYKKVTGSGLKGNGTKFKKFETGLAGYIRLKLSGENKEMDQAYDVIKAYIEQEVIDRIKKAPEY
jgi:hypothetical protein